MYQGSRSAIAQSHVSHPGEYFLSAKGANNFGIKIVCFNISEAFHTSKETAIPVAPKQ